MTHAALRSSHRRTISLGRLVAALLACTMISSCTSEAPAVHHKFVIPLGTARLATTNRAPEIFPSKLVVHVGDSLTIVNNDEFDQEIGPYVVKANTTLKQHFASAGVLQGSCKMSATGTVLITILPKE